ncbi:MAG: CPBP family intramembrane metalloprotease [Planctomycetes bacterium]|nr:CPBP family intramembrane metalloprotease [Planctomycetota bacterium]
MSESPLQIEALPNPSSGPVAVFPDLPWRVQDVVIGFVPPFALRIAVLIVPESIVVRYGGIATVLFFVWVWFYPAAVAWRRGARFQRPSAVRCLVESTMALPTLLTIWIGLGLIVGLILNLSPGMVVQNPFVEPAAANFNEPNPVFWALIVSAVLAAPIGEELFFRGMLYGTLKRHLDLKSAILLQGVIFGFAHSFGILHAIAASFLGIAFAIVYEWRKTIVAPMCVHVLQNGVAVTGALVMGMMIANGPYLGVFGEKHARGCEITSIEADSSAATAGIQVGDVIIDVQGTPIVDFPGLKVAIRTHQVGDHVSVQFYRGGELRKLDVELKKRPQSVKD